MVGFWVPEADRNLENVRFVIWHCNTLSLRFTVVFLRNLPPKSRRIRAQSIFWYFSSDFIKWILSFLSHHTVTVRIYLNITTFLWWCQTFMFDSQHYQCFLFSGATSHPSKFNLLEFCVKIHSCSRSQNMCFQFSNFVCVRDVDLQSDFY